LCGFVASNRTLSDAMACSWVAFSSTFPATHWGADVRVSQDSYTHGQVLPASTLNFPKCRQKAVERLIFSAWLYPLDTHGQVLPASTLNSPKCRQKAVERLIFSAWFYPLDIEIFTSRPNG
jgi:hypothetical protein